MTFPEDIKVVKKFPFSMLPWVVQGDFHIGDGKWFLDQGGWWTTDVTSATYRTRKAARNAYMTALETALRGRDERIDELEKHVEELEEAKQKQSDHLTNLFEQNQAKNRAEIQRLNDKIAELKANVPALDADIPEAEKDTISLSKLASRWMMLSKL